MRRRYCFFGLNCVQSGRLITSGQTAGDGVPHTRLMVSSCAHSWFAWKIGFFKNSSPRIHL